MLPLFAFQSLMMTGQAVVRLGVATEQYSELRSIAEAAVAEPAQGAPTDEDQPRYGGRYTGRRGDDFNVLTPARVWTQPGARERFVQCGALLLLTLLSMLVAIGFGGANANLAGGEWTQAWLMTFPVPTRSLVLAKGLEYSLVTFFPWLTLCPLTYQLLRALGHPWALPAAVGATLATTFLVGSARLYVETRLRLSCSLRALRSVQGACTLTALLLMALVFGIALGPSIPSWFLDLGGAAPAWLVWSPGAWPLAMAEHGAMGSAFSDWWAYKFEVYDAIPDNGAILHEAGVVVSFNSDSDEHARRLNTEAAKAVKYGGVAEHEALCFVTRNPAIQLGVFDRTGSLTEGKDADLALWSAHPLSYAARCESTWVDGRRMFSLERDAQLRAGIAAERQRLLRLLLSSGKHKKSRPGDPKDAYWAAEESNVDYCCRDAEGGRR
ncbi:MAG: amidohydrolase family protein [Planctomycetes bacterium]|nr:amidohydrolase family protein [Planctomycetota bacterium]